MSVSLREAQVTKILGNLLQGDKYDRDNFNSCLASVLALFPPQLTEEEVEKIITKVLRWDNKFVGNSEIGTPREIIKKIASALIGKCGNNLECPECSNWLKPEPKPKDRIKEAKS